MRLLPAREGLHCSPSFHPIPRACYRRVRDHDTIVVSHGRRSPRDGENPCHPASPAFVASASSGSGSARKKLPEKGAFCVLWQKTYGADRRISSAGKGGESAGQRKEKPCSSALSPCRCLGTSLALRLTHLRLGSDLPPRMMAAGTFQSDRKKYFRGRKGPLFQKGLLPPPPYNRPGDDSRTGKTSRPVPDRWRSARPFR